jgi:hypothetical protein
MRNSQPDPRPTRPRARALRPGWLAAIAWALAPLLLASCGTENPCDRPPTEIGGIVTDVQAAGDPCAGKPEKYTVAWFTQAGVKYPLRCGKTGRSGYGYFHITKDPTDDGGVGHGDPVNDASFSAEIAATLGSGVEGHVGGGTWRYTLEYSDEGKLCRNAWGFRVILAKQPLEPDGYPAGIITAFRYARRPAKHP